MYAAHESVMQRQRDMLTNAAAQRQAHRVHALDRADRRAARARRRLSQSRHEAMRLRGELAAEQRS
jgi:hypothetical protein